MNLHVANIVKMEKLGMGNEGPAIVFHAVCCGDEQSRICHTSYVYKKDEAGKLTAKTDEEIDEEVQTHIARCRQLHTEAERVEGIMRKYTQD